MTNSHLAAASYDAIASSYDSTYSSPHEIAENRLLASVLRKWKFFHLPEAPAVDAIRLPAPPVAVSTGHPDQRFRTEGDLVQRRQFLDIGCGTGLALELSRLAELPLPSTRYLGVDPSAGMIHIARKKFPEYTFLLGVAERMHQWGQFDRITALFGPFNYADPAKAFDALKRASAPGARVAIIVYTPIYQAHPKYILSGAPPMANFFTAAELRAALAKHRFHDIEINGMSPPAFYDYPEKTTTLELRALARNFYRTTPPDECCFLIAKAKRSA